MKKKLQVVIITGMSGAGKTVAIQSFEDLGYFVVDNMLPNLLSRFLDIIEESEGTDKVALVVDLRSRGFYDLVMPAIDKLQKRADVNTQLLFLDATDEELVSRYKETRRAHPLAPQGRVMSGIDRERTLLSEIKSIANLTVDTSNLSPRQLRHRLDDYFNNEQQTTFYVEVMSFGFKYGLPLDADIVMDVRFLPNPYYIPELKPLTGNDKPVSDYVMKQPLTEKFYSHFYSLLNNILPGYEKEGKTSLTIAIGCTGGQHRSVAIANRLSKDIGKNYVVNVSHRDVDKRKETTNRS
ncbi:P-loop ATPase family protein [Paucilactobacillus hokkaidonensis JCM 18461]|uniref:p-loop ATPase family protein n=1 Tax=Paucilactobacillus hokkaidonensis JCM 18461 TaxID=1291742 RepID=A0A0A1H0H5_9LACO|nr:RNase adapter RapZ [Paucilactobacillus hokkaidonensis]BAP86191.1 P-loop ATPase family protein [Paucilactobacillus hokkaidonensis JCM 18461]